MLVGFPISLSAELCLSLRNNPVTAFTHLRCTFYVFFFSSRRRHTRFDCDWSSDVCSSDLLLVSGCLCRAEYARSAGQGFQSTARRAAWRCGSQADSSLPFRFGSNPQSRGGDRKSTRLNSSHSQISYAVFCLKKKKKNTQYV